MKKLLCIGDKSELPFLEDFSVTEVRSELIVSRVGAMCEDQGIDVIICYLSSVQDSFLRNLVEQTNLPVVILGKELAKDYRFDYLRLGVQDCLTTDTLHKETLMVALENAIERKRYQKNQRLKILEASKDRLNYLDDRLLLATESAQIGTWDYDVVNNLLSWDDKMYELYGITEDTFSGVYEAWEGVVHPEDKDRAAAEVDAALNGEKEFNTDFRVIRPDSNVRHIRASASVLRNESGEPLRMIGANWDVTDEKLAEAERLRSETLLAKNMELAQFVYIASHDLQEPLRTVGNYISILEEDYGDNLDGEGKRLLSVIGSSANRMSKLVKGLLDYSRIGKSSDLSLVDCGQIVQEVLADLQLHILDSRAKVRVADLPVLKGYAVELRVLFQNLISNAIKYHKTGVRPDISISVKDNSEYYIFWISDKGIGIPEEYTERVFNIFQRLHLQKDYSGTGIGLAQSRKIVNLHGGDIWVESQLDEGSTFYFTISKYLKDK